LEEVVWLGISNATKTAFLDDRSEDLRELATGMVTLTMSRGRKPAREEAQVTHSLFVRVRVRV